jgi:hypothetical protein
MSRKNNVNPDYYKVRGRDRVHEDVVGGKAAPSASERDIERAAKAAERARERERETRGAAEKEMEKAAEKGKS